MFSCVLVHARVCVHDRYHVFEPLLVLCSDHVHENRILSYLHIIVSLYTYSSLVKVCVLLLAHHMKYGYDQRA